jgi:hypothetical protein
MRNKRNNFAAVAAFCLLLSISDISAARQKILSIEVRKVFRNYKSAKIVQAACSETFTVANKEL